MSDHGDAAPLTGGDATAAGAPAAMRFGARLRLALELERARWFYWVPVLLGCGIAAYFALPVEPPPWLAALLLLAMLALRRAVPRDALAGLAVLAFVIMATGYALITLRTQLVAAPILDQRIGPVEVTGYVELTEPREDRGLRVTLRVLRIDKLTADVLPRRVRIRLMPGATGLEPGAAVTVRAHLAPPAGPALPGGFDFGRTAFFAGIGGVGYAVTPPSRDETAPPPPWRLRLSAGIERLRRAIGDRIDAVLDGQTAAIAKALVTGERGGITEAMNNAYRDSGLFHILSISGLHMAIMGGAVFWTVRLMLALLPSIALRHPVKKWAALAAAAASLAYLAISGSSFATIRSFIMISIMFFAILLDRPAIALRNVAISALIILVLYPESLLDVGFQMSFAAVVALVAAYEAVRDRFASGRARDFGVVMSVLLFFGGIVLSTLVASAAVTPFAVYHFHKTQQFAVFANLLAVPLCNLVVMPGALGTLLLMPFGLEAAPLWVMGQGIDGMSWVARQVASWPGAVGYLPAIPDAAFALMLAGGLWLTLWHQRWRYLGLVAVACGLALAPLAARPAALIARDGELVAIRNASGVYSALAARQSKFELKRWLEHDGDARTPAAAVAEPGFNCDGVGCTARVGGLSLAAGRHPAATLDDCAAADVVVVPARAPESCTGPKAVIDLFAVRTRGTHAVYIEAAAGGAPRVHITSVADQRGSRPWAPPHPWTRPAGPVGRLDAASPNARTQQRGPGMRAAHVRVAQSRVGAFAAPLDLLDALRLPRPEVEDEDQDVASPAEDD